MSTLKTNCIFFYFLIIIVCFCSCIPVIDYHNDKKILQSLEKKHHVNSTDNIILYLCDENDKILLFCPEELQSISEYHFGFGSVAWGIGKYRHLLFVLLIEDNYTYFYSYTYNDGSFALSNTPIMKVQSDIFVNALTYPTIKKEPFVGEKMYFIKSKVISWNSLDDYMFFYKKWNKQTPASGANIH